MIFSIGIYKYKMRYFSVENDGKLEHRQYGEILFGQKTLQSRETLDEGKDFIKCNIRKLKKKEGWN